jgi:hypothetical protein
MALTHPIEQHIAAVLIVDSSLPLRYFHAKATLPSFSSPQDHGLRDLTRGNLATCTCNLMPCAVSDSLSFYIREF